MTRQSANAVLVEPAAPTELKKGSYWPAVGVLFWLTVRQHARARRLIVTAVLFALPAIIAVAMRLSNHEVRSSELETALIFLILPQALIPLAGLWYASGMIQDEIEEQTLTYLLIRPIARWTIYLSKLLATVLVICVLVCPFVMIAYGAIYWGNDELPAQDTLLRAVKMAGLFCLSLLTYCSLFGWLSLVVRRTLVVGVAYIFLLEGVVANIDFVARGLTVMYYFRVLAERWAEVTEKSWSITLSTAPTSERCLEILVGASVAFTAVAAVTFAQREFRVKTPEGS